ncbi:uncharacterized protein LACBIDRAFT_336006 [Laccaria bicolor S238N-H82]|uniref:Predicted protein n=1 Tax=Laccaria bicolor (strain S238N-H82 / ATCC MYA-4686) TaxID=486041 RepID=B0E448_LACBS|nr:uncharacterized protein LACBIDRAFT_336006 [Laccaria bicolor S238N-H82]EDQ98384.1 predicted protein [Laccaria bicolor S238N-H82]|eukprot:XP_001890966.1 predicted protein [Laccaria bicolor S238N-H82]
MSSRLGLIPEAAARLTQAPPLPSHHKPMVVSATSKGFARPHLQLRSALTDLAPLDPEHEAFSPDPNPGTRIMVEVRDMDGVSSLGCLCSPHLFSFLTVLKVLLTLVMMDDVSSHLDKAACTASTAGLWSSFARKSHFKQYGLGFQKRKRFHAFTLSKAVKAAKAGLVILLMLDSVPGLPPVGRTQTIVRPQLPARQPRLHDLLAPQPYTQSSGVKFSEHPVPAQAQRPILQPRPVYAWHLQPQDSHASQAYTWRSGVKHSVPSPIVPRPAAAPLQLQYLRASQAYTRLSRVEVSKHPVHAQAQLPRHSPGPSQMIRSSLITQSLRVPPPRQLRPYFDALYSDEEGYVSDSERGWPRQEETLSRRVTARRRLFDRRKKRKQLEKEEKLRTKAEGGDYGTDEADDEKEERRGRGRKRKRPGRREGGSKRKQAEDTRQGFQDWNSSDCFGHIYCDGLSTTNPISAALLQRAPLPDDSVPHSESIQERLCRLDKMDLSESRILLLEKIHQEMWAELPTIRLIKWDDLPWPVFVRTTCPKDLMFYRIVSYSLQVSSGMDIKEALVNSNRLQWAQQRLRILLGCWGQPGLQKKLKNSPDKTMIQGVNTVTNHLENVLDFVNMHQIDETHHTDLTAIISQTFLKHFGENLARILTDTSDNSGYKSLLRLEGDSAQKMLNFLQTLVSLPRNDILGALLRLSKLSKLYPECLTITDLERNNDVLDSGRFGEIYKGRSRNQVICLKVIKVTRKTQIKHLLKAFFKEALLWGHLSHPNILPFYGIYHLEDAHGRISFVSPWMENGNITEYLKRHPLANRLLLIWDIILGIQFLHQNQVIHGDLKGLNVLVNRSGRSCLADFGLANLVDEDILRWTSIQSTGHQSGGTLRWQAPELINPPSDESAKATPASDIYSFACVCYEFPRDCTVMMKVLEGSRPPRPADTSTLSDEIWKLIEMCWNQEPQDRPSAELVIEQLPLAGIVDDRPSGGDHLAPPDFRAGGPKNLGVVFNPAVDIILSSVLRSTPTNEVEPHAI